MLPARLRRTSAEWGNPTPDSPGWRGSNWIFPTKWASFVANVTNHTEAFEMVEANPFKFYFAKYFFLAFGLLQWIVAALIFFRLNGSNRGIFGSLIFFTLGLI